MRSLPQHSTANRRLARVGGWLFRHRTVVALPVATILLIVPPSRASESRPSLLAGWVLVAMGETLRLWAVHQIGAISRTRSERLGPLVATGPFSRVRNPLYLANMLLWIGFTLSARLAWLVPFIVAVLGLEYNAIVKWEEELLATRLGTSYREYAARVPRWVPSLKPRVQPQDAATFPWRATFFSERGTLMAIAVAYLLLWLRARL